MSAAKLSPRVNIGIARDVHKAVQAVLVKGETLVGFTETMLMAEVARRGGEIVALFHAMDQPERGVSILEELSTPPRLTATEASMDLRRDQEIERAKRHPAPKGELDELKEQVARLTEMMSRAIPAQILNDRGIEAPDEELEREQQREKELDAAPAGEMVIDWNLVPENVPEASRLITEADDDARPGVCVQFWRLSTGKSLKTSTRGSVMVPAEEPAPGGLKPSGNAPSGGFPDEDSGFDSTLNTPEDAGPLSPVLPARTAKTAPEQPEEAPADGTPPLVSRAAHRNEHGRKVRPSDPTRSQVSRIQMLNNMVDGSRMGSNAPKTEEKPLPRRTGNTTPPTRPAVRKPAPTPARAVPRASFA